MEVCDSAQTCASPLLYAQAMTSLTTNPIRAIHDPEAFRGLDRLAERVAEIVERCELPSKRLKFSGKKKKPVAKSA